MNKPTTTPAIDPLVAGIRGTTTVMEPLVTNTKQPGQFRFASLGDLHLGHHRTPSHFIIRNLTRYFTPTRIRSLDAIFITGDVFDRLLTLGDPQIHDIIRWVTDFLNLCSVHNVSLFIVEGTPSHDHEQSTIFSEQLTNMQISLDLHYVTTLSIRYIEKFGVHILFVPDKWNGGQTDATLADVKKLMAEKQIDRVDFAVMHGAFEYQLPDKVTEPAHSSAEYLRLVRYFILIGHVHLMTEYERILAAGSFDRDTHGQEAAKGFFEVTVYSASRFEITFVKNEHAKRFVTVDVSHKDMKETRRQIAKVVKALPVESHVRLRCELNHPLASDHAQLKKEYPEIIWSPPDIKGKDKKENENPLEEFDFSDFADITKDTIYELLAVDLKRLTADATQIERCQQRLKARLE